MLESFVVTRFEITGVAIWSIGTVLSGFMPEVEFVLGREDIVWLLLSGFLGVPIVPRLLKDRLLVLPSGCSFMSSSTSILRPFGFTAWLPLPKVMLLLVERFALRPIEGGLGSAVPSGIGAACSSLSSWGSDDAHCFYMALWLILLRLMAISCA